MKKERQIKIRIILPEPFTLDVEDAYEHASGAHKALSFTGFLGLLIGLGLKAYRRTYKGTAVFDEKNWVEQAKQAANFTPRDLLVKYKMEKMG
jgi:hypothetical protein